MLWAIRQPAPLLQLTSSAGQLDSNTDGIRQGHPGTLAWQQYRSPIRRMTRYESPMRPSSGGPLGCYSYLAQTGCQSVDSRLSLAVLIKICRSAAPPFIARLKRRGAYWFRQHRDPPSLTVDASTGPIRRKSIPRSQTRSRWPAAALPEQTPPPSPGLASLVNKRFPEITDRCSGDPTGRGWPVFPATGRTFPAAVRAA